MRNYCCDYHSRGGESDAFNLGNGLGFTVKEAIDVARKVTGHPGPARGLRGKGEKILGWKPKYDDLNTIVSTAWAWHKNLPNGYGE